MIEDTDQSSGAAAPKKARKRAAKPSAPSKTDVPARLRARAENRLLLLTNLSDRDARLAKIIIGHVAAVMDGEDEPVITPPRVVKLKHE